jgi:spore coat protein CotH
MCLPLFLACFGGGAGGDAKEIDPAAIPGQTGAGDVLFATDALPVFRLTIDEPDWEDALEDLIVEDGCEPRPWLAADLAFENPVTGETERWADVGVRYRGHSSLWWPNGEGGNRWGLKLSFDAFVPGREFHDGLEVVNLLGTEGDPSGLREVLGLELLRDAGVPAPRASWAHLWVNDVYLGVFPDSEEADDGAYVARTFGVDGGSLYEVSGYCGYGELAYRGDDDPASYDGFEPKGDTTEDDKRADLVPFLRCASEADADAFAACLPTWVDVPGWLRLMAVDALAANYDGLAAAGHNYLLWFPPDGSPAIVWPYDLDLSFYGDRAFIASDDIFGFHPTWVPAAPALARRIRNVWAEEYCAEVLAASPPLDPSRLGPRIEAMRTRLAPLVEGDPFLDASDWGEAVDDVARVAEDRFGDAVAQAEACHPP